MLTTVNGYWLRIIAPSDFVLQEITLAFPPGTNVYANISLNELNTYFLANSTDPKFSATSYIPYWSFYLDDGNESQREGMGFNQNAVAINNCASIRFVLEGIHVAATALVNIFTY